MDFGTNKTPIEVIKEVAFGGTYFRDIHPGVNEDGTKSQFDQFKNIDQKYYCVSSIIMMLVLRNMVLNVEHRYEFDKIKPGLMSQVLMDGFSSTLETGQVEDYKIMKNKLIEKGIVSRFRGKLVKMIKDAGSKFDDYSISPKIRNILLYWGYKLAENDFFINY